MKPINIDAPAWTAAKELRRRSHGDIWVFDDARHRAVTLYWSREAEAYVVREWQGSICPRKWTTERLDWAHTTFLLWAREIIVAQAVKVLTNG